MLSSPTPSSPKGPYEQVLNLLMIGRTLFVALGLGYVIFKVGAGLTQGILDATGIAEAVVFGVVGPAAVWVGTSIIARLVEEIERSERDRAEAMQALVHERTAASNRATQVQTLFDTVRLMVVEGTLEEKVRGVVDTLASRVGVDLIVASLAEAGAFRTVAVAGSGRTHAQPRKVWQPESLDPPAYQALSEKSRIVANELTEAAHPRLYERGYSSAAWFPVLVAKQPVGLLSLASKTPDFFTPAHVEFLTATSTSIGAFIEQARLLESEQERRRELETLFTIASILVENIPPEEKAVRALRAVATASDSFRVVLWVPNETEQTLEPLAVVQAGVAGQPAARQLAFGEGHVGAVYRDRAPLILTDYSKSGMARQAVLDQGVRSAAILPVEVQGQCVAILSAYGTQTEHYDAARVRLLEAISGSLGVLLQTARLQEEVNRERQLQREKDAFVSVASHQLRTPLTSILGYSELLLNRKVKEETRERMMGLIHRSSARLSAIVEDLLSLSRIEAGEIIIHSEPVSLADAAAEAVAQVRHDPAKHQISVEIASDLTVVGDGPKLIDVLINLVSNAVKYSPEGGDVSVKAAREPENGRIVIAIADQGMGIEESDVPRLFKPFRRINRAETLHIEGTGLGLAIVKAYVTRMSGDVWVESKLDKGTTFFVALPCADGVLAPAQALPDKT